MIGGLAHKVRFIKLTRKNFQNPVLEPAKSAFWAYQAGVAEGYPKGALLLAFAHHRLVAIHPFVNGNGRTARLFTNLLAYTGCGLVPPGEWSTQYLQAIRQADDYKLLPLQTLISAQLRPLAE